MKRLIVIIILMIFVPVFTLAQANIEVECGDIVENEFTESYQPQSYSINLSAGTSLQVSGAPLGETLQLAIGVIAPNERMVAANDPDGSYNYPNSEPFVNSGVLSANGDYTLMAYNGYFYTGRPWSDNRDYGVGVYTLFIGCTLRDGTVIQPGDNPDIEPTEIPRTPFSGYGFPGLSSIDFSNGIEIPITTSQPLPIPVGSDVTLLTYDGVAGTTATLSILRMSGDISVGITVINQSDNNIIFLGGMPYTDNLSANLTFPTDGTYVIGIFRLDTPTLTGTAGAVQVMIE